MAQHQEETLNQAITGELRLRFPRRKAFRLSGKPLNFCDSGAAMVLLIETLAKLGYRMEYCVYSKEFRNFDVKLEGAQTGSGHPPTWHGVAPTAPLALVKAAIEALGIQVQKPKPKKRSSQVGEELWLWVDTDYEHLWIKDSVLKRKTGFSVNELLDLSRGIQEDLLFEHFVETSCIYRIEYRDKEEWKRHRELSKK